MANLKTELLLITFDGVCSGEMWSLCEETGGPGETPCVPTGDHRTLWHSPLQGSNTGRSSDKRVAYHCAIRTPRVVLYSDYGTWFLM